MRCPVERCGDGSRRADGTSETDWLTDTLRKLWSSISTPELTMLAAGTDREIAQMAAAEIVGRRHAEIAAEREAAGEPSWADVPLANPMAQAAYEAARDEMARAAGR